MSEEVRRTLEGLVREGEVILQEYENARQTLANPSTDAGRTMLSEFAGAVAGESFGSARAASHARRLSRSWLKEDQRSRLKQLEIQTQGRVDSWIDRVRTFLSGVSTAAATLEKPDSHTLVARFLRITEYSKPETRLKNGLRILRTPALQGILRNEDLKSGRTKPTGLVVSPGQQFEGFEKVLDIMSSTIGNVIVVDPYPGDDTLVAIRRCPAGQPVQFLTCPPLKDSERLGFEALARRLMSDRHEIQIRYAPEGVLHDRFISSQNGTWLLGHSIKDVGKKLSTISPASKETAEALRKKAIALWKESKSLEQTGQSSKRSGT